MQWTRRLRKHGWFIVTNSFLFIRLIFWVLLIRVLRPRVSMQRLTSIAKRNIPTLNIRYETLNYAFQLLSAMKLFGTSNPCVPRSLVHYRFFRAIGEKPRYMIGIASINDGHAWIVLRGKPYMENPDNLSRYIPMMQLDDPASTLQPVATGSVQA